MEHRHPQHDAIAATLRAWYTTSAPAMGFRVERRPFGLYLRYPPDAGEVALRDAGPEDVPALLADVRAYYGNASVGIYLDDRQSDATLGPALVQAGCTKGTAVTHLVHVGAVPAVHPVPRVVLEPLTEATLTEFAITKLQGFASSEVALDPRRLAAEVAMRRAELADDGRFFLARASGEPAAILGIWDGDDRLGFTDEVYWRQRYEPTVEGILSQPAMHPTGLRLIVQSPVSQSTRKETLAAVALERSQATHRSPSHKPSHNQGISSSYRHRVTSQTAYADLLR